MSTPAKLGPTISVDASSNAQYVPSIAALANGQFVVVWKQYFPAGQDFNNPGDGLLGQYFNANGDSSGASFGIWVPNGVFYPEIAWGSDLIGLTNGGFSAVYAFNSMGDGLFNHIEQDGYSGTTDTGSTGIVDNPDVGNIAENPDQAELTNGTIVVTWDDAVNGGDIFADIVTTSGAILNASPIAVSTVSGTQSSPSVAALANGDFAIAWQDTTNNTVWMQRYDASGNALGVNTQVPAHNSGTQSAPAVAALPGGQYVVAYVDTSGAYSGDTSGSAIVARVFNAEGSAVTDFLVDTTSSGDQTKPAIVALADGRFFVAWVDASGAGGAGTDIRGQLFKSNGSGGFVADGSELLIDTPGGSQDTPSLSVTPDGRILVSWQTTVAAASGIDVQMLDPREHGMTFSATMAAEQFYGTAYNDVLYARVDTVFTGGGGFDTVIETNPGVTINVGAGTTLYQVQEVILAGGTNVVDGSYSTDFIYLYGGGSGSTNTMTLGAGGGYEISNSGTNHMFGGSDTAGNGVSVGNTRANDVFIGGVGASDMHGGSGVNLYYMGADDTVAGAGAYNTVIEQFSTGVTWNFGNDDIQQVNLSFGTNVLDMTGSTSFVTLYCGNYESENTVRLGAGGGYILSAGGVNHMYGGGGTSVFVGFSYPSPAHGSDMHGGSGNNLYYMTADDTAFGAGTYNTVVLLAQSVTFKYGINLTNVQEVVLNGGTNSLDMTGSTDFDYLYGGAGTNTMTLGSGGGYELSSGGTNHMYGGASGSGTDVFIGGAGISDMHGGTGNNVYYAGVNDTVTGAGTYNTLVELSQGVNLVLGSSALSNVQQFILNGGNNTLDASSATTQLIVYGGSGSDTLIGGTGDDFLHGEGGTNTFAFQAGWGHDTIMDWTAGTSDQIDLTGLAGSGVHAVTDLTQTITAGNDVITSSHTGTNSITLLGVGAALTAGSFHFA